MTIQKIRRWLYFLAKYAGDVQAILSPKRNAVSKRIGRRIAGYGTGRAIGRIFRP